MVYLQRLKAGKKIIKVTKTNATKWTLGFTPQHSVSRSWREVGATVPGRVQENSFSPRKSSVSTFKGVEARKEFSKYRAFSEARKNGLFNFWKMKT